MTTPSAEFMMRIGTLLADRHPVRMLPRSLAGRDGPIHRLTRDGLIAAAEALSRFVAVQDVRMRAGTVTAKDPARPTEEVVATEKPLDTLFRHRELALAEEQGRPMERVSPRHEAKRMPITAGQRSDAMTLTIEKTARGGTRLLLRTGRRLLGTVNLEHGAEILRDSAGDSTMQKLVMESLVGSALGAVEAALSGWMVPQADMDDAIRYLSAASDCGSERQRDGRRYAFLPFAVGDAIIADDDPDGQKQVVLDERQKDLRARAQVRLGRVFRIGTGFHEPTPMLFDIEIRHVSVELPRQSTAETLRTIAELAAMPNPADGSDA